MNQRNKTRRKTVAEELFIAFYGGRRVPDAPMGEGGGDKGPVFQLSRAQPTPVRVVYDSWIIFDGVRDNVVAPGCMLPRAAGLTHYDGVWYSDWVVTRRRDPLRLIPFEQSKADFKALGTPASSRDKDGLKGFVVWALAGLGESRAFTCKAEDEQHALELVLNANPSARVTHVACLAHSGSPFVPVVKKAPRAPWPAPAAGEYTAIVEFRRVFSDDMEVYAARAENEAVKAGKPVERVLPGVALARQLTAELQGACDDGNLAGQFYVTEVDVCGNTVDDPLPQRLFQVLFSGFDPLYPGNKKFVRWVSAYREEDVRSWLRDNLPFGTSEVTAVSEVYPNARMTSPDALVDAILGEDGKCVWRLPPASNEKSRT
jgi:hypothetical protein